MTAKEIKQQAITAMRAAINRLQQLSGCYAGNETEINGLRQAIKMLES